MRIGIDARLYRSSVAGIGRYSQNLIKNILELDRENEYVLFMTSEDKAEFDKSEIRMSNVKIIVTDIKHYSLAEQIKLPKIIAAEKVDLMHFLNFNVPVAYRGKFIVTIHDLTLFFYPGRSRNNIVHKLAYKYIMGQACKKSEQIIAVSESTKNDMIKVFKTPKDKIQVIYEAADDKNFAAAPIDVINRIKKQYNIIEETPVILYVGQWRPHKNLIGLIEAFENIRKDIPAKLAIVGKADPAFPAVQKTIDKSAYLRDIIKPGFVSDEELSAWYKIARVFVFPSYYEGFGLPGLEAMMAGIPVVSSDRTSLPEIYGDAAVYFNPADPNDLAAKIKKVITDKNLHQELIAKGQEKVKTYSWAKMARETLEIYKSIK